MNELGVKVGVEDSVDGVVQESVSDGGFVDVSRFGIGDVESVVWAVGISLVFEV